MISRRNTDDILVSIITPSLNGTKYLGSCLKSVLNQDYPYIEHVLVDGGSTDGTVDMLSRYQAKYPGRIRFISEPDKNACDAWNKGILLSKGEILGWLGTDDYYEPGAIRSVVEFFKFNPNAFFVYGARDVIDENGALIRKPPVEDFNIREAINGRCYISTTSSFYRREVIDKVGLMDTSINACDLDFWIRVGRQYKMHRINQKLSCFRITKDSVSGKNGALRMYAREGYILNRRYGGSLLSALERYIRLSLMDWLRPVLGNTYDKLERVNLKIHRLSKNRNDISS